MKRLISIGTTDAEAQRRREFEAEVDIISKLRHKNLVRLFGWCDNSNAACSFGLSATSQQYFSLRINQPSATSQQYFSLRTNQHQPSATSQPNRLHSSLFTSSSLKAASTVAMTLSSFFVGTTGLSTLKIS
jgi:hypothetical protein